MEMQRQRLTDLQKGCFAHGEGDSCYSIGFTGNSQGGNSDLMTGFNLGYGFTDYFSVGATLGYSLSRSLPDSYKRNNHNIGGGLYAYFYIPFGSGRWYLKPSVAFNQYDIEIHPPLLPNIQAGIGDSKMKGWSTRLEAGQEIQMNQDISIHWHIGASHHDISRSGYKKRIFSWRSFMTVLIIMTPPFTQEEMLVSR